MHIAGWKRRWICQKRTELAWNVDTQTSRDTLSQECGLQSSAHILYAEMNECEINGSSYVLVAGHLHRTPVKKQ